MIGGAAMIHGHIEIADGVRISTNTLITKSLKKPGTYTSALPFSEHGEWLKNAVHMRNLDKLVDRIKELEKRIAEIEGKDK
jgi:UDP-3-O-[3-hydroxymyristoyl] glucosamine N-acyltransferase